MQFYEEAGKAVHRNFLYLIEKQRPKSVVDSSCLIGWLVAGSSPTSSYSNYISRRILVDIHFYCQEIFSCRSLSYQGL
jgi:hypothetical protein